MMSPPMQTAFDIEPARSAADIASVAALLVAYADSLDVDLAVQGFAAELAGLPGRYAPPQGEMLLARRSDGEPIGCVALRPLAVDDACEMKRLYVGPAGRGLGLGRALVLDIARTAARIGYRTLLLDTLPSMTAAIALYRTLGFAPVPPYADNPIEGAMFMGLTLPADRGRI
jgi:ribosomal protein S18 acetylase RimI-like enzyme